MKTIEKILIGVAQGFVLVAALGIGVKVLHHRAYYEGWRAAMAEVDKAKEQGKKDNEETKDRDGQKEVVVITETVEVEKIIYRDGKTIIKEVPVYVTPEADASCVVTLGAVSLHDAGISARKVGTQDPAAGADAASATAQDPVPVPEWANDPSGVPLSAFTAVTIENATAFHVLNNRFEGLKKWTAEQCYGPP